jgi:hypothetical protein
MNILETQRLLLGHPVLEDLDDVFAFYSDPDVVKYIQMELKGKSEPIGVYVFQAAQHRRI